MRCDIVKYFTDWKTAYLIWIVCSWLLTNKPSPNYYGYLFEEYELAWWIIGCIITLIAVWHLYKRNWMQATLLFLLFAVPKFLVYIGNMEAKAYLRYVRISPRKVQIVCDLIRGKDAKTAMAILMNTPKSASEPLVKLLKSACANAENNFSMDPDKLVVTQVFATPGPILKRMMPRAQGRAYRINKRTSHVTLAVAERD